MSGTIELACAADAAYVPHCAVMLRSVMEQHAGEPVRLHFLCAPELPQSTLEALGAEVRAAGGTWTAYRRQSRKDVLRLRSLVVRGRARSRRRATGGADPVIGRVLGLPNELCWHVLKFWRATSDAIGEVI